MRVLRRLVALLVLFAAACGAPAEAPAPEPGTETAGTISPAPSTAAPSAPEAPQTARCEPSPDRICPVDEGTTDASFVRYRDRLADAIRRRDTEALVGAIDPTIRTGFGPGGGIDDFRTQWKLDSGESTLWSELDAILSLGGAFRGEGESRSFWAPYVYAAWPEGKDAFTHVAALGPDTEIRAEARADAPLIGTVHWTILELIMREGFRPYAPWLEVRLPDGRTGFVRNEEVRGPIEWRAGFMKQKGEWKMVALVAGD